MIALWRAKVYCHHDLLLALEKTSSLFFISTALLVVA